MDDIDIDTMATMVCSFGEDDEDMVNDLFRRTCEYMQRIVAGAASARLIQQADVADVVQDAAVAVWRWRDRWDAAKGSWTTWCGQAARSAIRAQRRRYIKERAVLQRESGLYYDAENVACPSGIAADPELAGQWDAQIAAWRTAGVGIDSRMLYNLYDRLRRKIKGGKCDKDGDR